ncbi:MAG: amino acid adenylation domain-containing protein [Gemmatimonadaceae bacterium]|nr:amino acid adenylation domain-containing protein [Gemmatimonadaceae bacterium]
MARRQPAQVAVEAPDGALTYAELERRSNQLAHVLRSRGVQDRALVGVCVDRTSSLPVALLAVLKAGAAYVPVDPAYPADRIRYTLTDAQVSCVITETRFAPLVDTGAPLPVVYVDTDADAMAAHIATPPETTVGPSDLAYVIYTSGSTGRPKGVEVEHGNLVNFLTSMAREPGMQSDDVLLAVTTPAFDIAGLELFLPLLVGARIVIASREAVMDGEQLLTLVARHGVTIMQATPATWRLMLGAGWSGQSALRALCGGEAMPRELARELLARTSALWNMYGPTETTVWSTIHRVTDWTEDIPVGKPIANTSVYVLDPAGRPAPIGVTGELCIGGDGVVRGYHARPELTAEKFVWISIAGRPPERVYRTGDLARWRSDLTLDFLGRRDEQVKLRGYRIELGEIEAVLAELPAVRSVAVMVREDAPGDQRLTAYVVPSSPETPLPVDALRQHLRSRVPEYMVPAAFIALPALPLTGNGKVDRRALPAPQVATVASSGGPAVPMSEAQARVAAIWRSVLRVDQVGPNDNFFDLGGHSLLVVKVLTALRAESSREITLVDLFQFPTVAAQANLLTSNGSEHDDRIDRARLRAARQLGV